MRTTKSGIFEFHGSIRPQGRIPAISRPADPGTVVALQTLRAFLTLWTLDECVDLAQTSPVRPSAASSLSHQGISGILFSGRRGDSGDTLDILDIPETLDTPETLETLGILGTCGLPCGLCSLQFIFGADDATKSAGRSAPIIPLWVCTTAGEPRPTRARPFERPEIHTRPIADLAPRIRIDATRSGCAD